MANTPLDARPDAQQVRALIGEMKVFTEGLRAWMDICPKRSDVQTWIFKLEALLASSAPEPTKADYVQLEAAAHHFRRCRTCAEDGPSSCHEGQILDEFLTRISTRASEGVTVVFFSEKAKPMTTPMQPDARPASLLEDWEDTVDVFQRAFAAAFEEIQQHDSQPWTKGTLAELNTVARIWRVVRDERSTLKAQLTALEAEREQWKADKNDLIDAQDAIYEALKKSATAVVRLEAQKEAAEAEQRRLQQENERLKDLVSFVAADEARRELLSVEEFSQMTRDFENFRRERKAEQEAAASALAKLQTEFRRLAEGEHERLCRLRGHLLSPVGAESHNAGFEWPDVDDDSWLAFENCLHPDCKLARATLPRLSGKEGR